MLHLIGSLDKEMRQASRLLEFERAAQLRDMIVELKERVGNAAASKGKAKSGGARSSSGRRKK